jgi:hypothetical protein
MKRLEDMAEPELSTLMTAMAKSIESIALIQNVTKPHFALLLFNDPKVAQYIGNCERSDIIKALREAADRLERNQDVRR